MIAGEAQAHAAKCPLLMANARSGEHWRHVLIAIDMPQDSGQAARAALALGLIDEAEANILHARAPATRQMMIHAVVGENRVGEEVESEF